MPTTADATRSHFLTLISRHSPAGCVTFNNPHRDLQQMSAPIQRTSLQVRHDVRVLQTSIMIMYHTSLTQFYRHFFAQLYRDCLRLVRHIAPGATSAKAVALQHTVRTEFKKNAKETDPDKITDMKASAVRALSNYLLTASVPKDPQLRSSAKDFHGRSVEEANEEKNQRRPKPDR